MTTYTNEQSFCECVLHWLVTSAPRFPNETPQIHRQTCRHRDGGWVLRMTAIGITATGTTQRSALFELCRQIVRAHKLPLAFDPDACQTKDKPKDPWQHFASGMAEDLQKDYDKIMRDYFASMYS